MPIKYIPYLPDPIQGQALLNVSRSRRLLRYRDNDKVFERVRRGLPYHEVELQERVGKASDGWNNLLLRGECLSACAYLKEQGVKVDLVYIDPPFDSGANYAKQVYLRRNPHKAKQVAQATQKLELDGLRVFEETMYGDIWRKEDYLNWMYENLTAIRAVMSNTASIYVHLDWHIGHYVKVLMDEVFGEDNFQREIVWDIQVLSGFKTQAANWVRGHDVVFYYTISGERTFNKLMQEHTQSYLDMFKGMDEDGRRFLVAHGKKRYLDEVKARGKPFGDVWNDIMSFQQQPTSSEKVDYPTQKPEALLERIIKASSDEDMIVADFFSGSGTTAKVAHDLNRRFVVCDTGINALQTTRDRLVEAGASFQVVEVKDGVSLFRNPQQTMDKLAQLIPGLQRQVTGIGNFWFGTIQDSKLDSIPVYAPDLVNSSEKVLDIPAINRIINEELPKLEEPPAKAIVYFVDIDDRKGLEDFIHEHAHPMTTIELRDLKAVLAEVFSSDEVTCKVVKVDGGFETRITSFHSDRLRQKIDEYNTKRRLNPSTRKKKAEPILVSDQGLELIEWLAVDCENADGLWHSSSEIRIDKHGHVTISGSKTKEFWNGAIRSVKKPLRIRVRSIADDETVALLSDG